MGKPLEQDTVMRNKNSAIKKLDTLLDTYLNSNDPKLLKKVNLISYWIRDFSNYVSYETNFDPKRNINYKRGDVINVNFGFNINSEFGGRHYAIVLNNKPMHHSDSLTVIPLTSFSPSKKIHERDVFLGNELYQRLDAKINTLIREAETKLSEVKTINDAYVKTKSDLQDKIRKLEPTSDFATELTPDDIIAAQSLESLSNVIKTQMKAIDEDIHILKAHRTELLHLKQGSIAKIEQITTISKMRIYNPKKSIDTLYKIRLGKSSMEKINDKIKELFCF